MPPHHNNILRFAGACLPMSLAAALMFYGLPSRCLSQSRGTAEGQQAQAGRVSSDTARTPEPLLVRRVIVLSPVLAEAISPQSQRRVDLTAQKIMAARQNSKTGRRRRARRPSALPMARNTAPPADAGGRTAAGTSVGTKEITRPLPATPGEAGGAQSGGLKTPDRPTPARAPDTLPPDQQNALAQTLLSDLVAERLRDRLGLVIAPDADVQNALKTLHLNTADVVDPARPENARRLCALLGCQALLVPKLSRCTLHDGLTRDAGLWARVTILTLSPDAGQALAAPRSRKSRQESEGIDAERWPTRLEIAGSAFAERVLFHSRYQRSQPDLIRDAAVQASNLLTHTLQTNETAPLMRPTDRLAVAPVPAPPQADKLVFTARGRRVYPDAAQGLSADDSALWTPNLLPLAPASITDADQVRQALAREGRTSAYLWKDAYQPDMSRVQALAYRLKADYVLMARVTDVELSEGATDASGASAGASSFIAPTGVSPTAAFEKTQNKAIAGAAKPTRYAPERAARAEALAMLVRVSDGTVVWRERATATMTTAPDGQYAVQTDADLVRDASHFALIELQRRLRHWRADFEK